MIFLINSREPIFSVRLIWSQATTRCWLRKLMCGRQPSSPKKASLSGWSWISAWLMPQPHSCILWMIYYDHSQTHMWLYIWMTSSSSTKFGRNIWSIFNRYWAPYDITSYMPIWRSVPSACRESNIWVTSWMSRLYTWIHPRPKSFVIG